MDKTKHVTIRTLQLALSSFILHKALGIVGQDGFAINSIPEFGAVIAVCGSLGFVWLLGVEMFTWFSE